MLAYTLAKKRTNQHTSIRRTNEGFGSNMTTYFGRNSSSTRSSSSSRYGRMMTTSSFEMSPKYSSKSSGLNVSSVTSSDSTVPGVPDESTLEAKECQLIIRR